MKHVERVGEAINEVIERVKRAFEVGYVGFGEAPLTEPVEKGRQVNVATGGFPASQIKTILDEGGYVVVFRTGRTYRVIAHLRTVPKGGWPKLQSYEPESKLLVPLARKAD